MTTINIGEKIKYYRLLNKMTQYDLAARVKTTPQNIYKYEKGIVTIIPLENIKRIAEIFGISPVTLVGWEEEEVEKLKTSCSERIDIALKIRDMKQADLVRLTGIGKSSISTYISGEYEPKQKNIYKIARALNVNEAWLMGYDVPMEREKPILEQEKANKLPHESLESRLVRFYDRPIEQIEKIEAPECDWGEPQGNEVW